MNHFSLAILEIFFLVFQDLSIRCESVAFFLSIQLGIVLIFCISKLIFNFAVTFSFQVTFLSWFLLGFPTYIYWQTCYYFLYLWELFAWLLCSVNHFESFLYFLFKFNYYFFFYLKYAVEVKLIVYFNCWSFNSRIPLCRFLCFFINEDCMVTIVTPKYI